MGTVSTLYEMSISPHGARGGHQYYGMLWDGPHGSCGWIWWYTSPVHHVWCHVSNTQGEPLVSSSCVVILRMVVGPLGLHHTQGSTILGFVALRMMVHILSKTVHVYGPAHPKQVHTCLCPLRSSWSRSSALLGLLLGPLVLELCVHLDLWTTLCPVPEMYMHA